ncbi:hypothetical protein CIRMBP1210_01779 [Enterococcus cecorum]|nr:hypothetical protein CIRMBP1210_01779 [Enterococcus cecorum]
MTDIANRYFVSPKTVERILKSYTYEVNPYTYQLPECLLVDEFKGTKDCNTKLCFIFSDGETGKIIDISMIVGILRLKTIFCTLAWKIGVV